MTSLEPSNVPVYGSDAERQMLWERNAGNEQPVVAIRNARRGWIVRYDLSYLDTALRSEAVQRLRDSIGDRRPYPTGTDPISQAEGVGGEAGPVSGDLHESSEEGARELAAHVSTFVFDRSNWT